jgi:hypothetical protein
MGRRVCICVCSCSTIPPEIKSRSSRAAAWRTINFVPTVRCEVGARRSDQFCSGGVEVERPREFPALARRRRRRWWRTQLADAVPRQDLRDGGGPGDQPRRVVGPRRRQLRGVEPAGLVARPAAQVLQAQQLLQLHQAAQHICEWLCCPISLSLSLSTTATPSSSNFAAKRCCCCDSVLFFHRFLSVTFFFSSSFACFSWRQHTCFEFQCCWKPNPYCETVMMWRRIQFEAVHGCCTQFCVLHVFHSSFQQAPFHACSSSSGPSG